MIPYGRQEVTEDDIQAVINVLKSPNLTQGPVIEEFETGIRQVCGAKYAIAMSSATTALHTAYLALGVTKGDLVWTSPITFVATANSAVYCGASIDFVDIDLQTFNISLEKLRDKLEIADRQGRLPRVLTVVHMAGQSCEMSQIHELSQKYGFAVLEDASHAIGASHLSDPVGSCRYSDITVFSFHPVKIVTTGEGGAAVTNDSRLARQMQLLRSHGITRNPSEMVEPSAEPWYYEQLELGFNYRLTDLQAALGSSQLRRLPRYVNRRNDIACFYTSAFSNLDLHLQRILPENVSAYHLFVLRIGGHENMIRQRRLEMARYLTLRGVATNLHYIPVYRHPFHSSSQVNPSDFTNAESYYRSALTIPLFPSMSDSEVEYVSDAVKEAVHRTA